MFWFRNLVSKRRQTYAKIYSQVMKNLVKHPDLSEGIIGNKILNRAIYLYNIVEP